MASLLVIWGFLLISLVSTSGFGIWNVFAIFRRKNYQAAYKPNIQRHFNHMYILIPALNEAGQIVNAVNLMHRVVHHLPITTSLVIINDGSDDGTGEKLKQFSSDPFVHVITRELPNARQGKGLALNAGLRWIESQSHHPKNTIVGVIDSDAKPTRQVMERICQAFIHSNYDLIQTAIAINNVSNFLTLMQAFEFDYPNLLQQVIRTEWGSAIASGNGQFMTLQMAADVKWHNALLDDLEFSINGLLKGYRGGFLADTFMPQEGVLTYRPLVKQRVRWCQGGMQCLFKYGKVLFFSKRIPSKLKTEILIFMGLPFLSIIFSISSIISFGVLIAHLFIWPASSIIIGTTIFLISMFITAAMIAMTDHSLHHTKCLFSVKQASLMTVGNLIYIWQLVPVAYIALIHLMTNQTTWAKTAHAMPSEQHPNNSQS